MIIYSVACVQELIWGATVMGNPGNKEQGGAVSLSIRVWLHRVPWRHQKLRKEQRHMNAERTLWPHIHNCDGSSVAMKAT